MCEKCKGNNDERKNAEWFDHGPVVSREANGLLYEVWANGTFRATAPNGQSIKTIDSAYDWLVDNGVTNDRQLEDIMDYENNEGWHVDMSRWFDLIVFTVEMVGDTRHLRELYCGEPTFYYDEDDFNAWIDEAIADDMKDGGDLNEAN